MANSTRYGSIEHHSDNTRALNPFSTNKHRNRGNTCVERIEVFLDRQFHLEERGTTVWKEFRAGFTTYLTIAYILVVVPGMLASPNSDLSRSQVLVATAISSAISSFIAGIYSNLPIACGPGLGLSAYLSYGLIQTRNVPWESALSLSFYSGLFMLFMGLIGVSERLMRFIPSTIKLSTVAGTGLLLSFIALQEVHLVVGADFNLVKLGPLGDARLWISCISLVLLASLQYHRVTGATLLSIFLVTVLLRLISTGHQPMEFLSLPELERTPFGKILDFNSVLAMSTSDSIPALFAFIAAAIFDVSGVLFGCAKMAELFDHEEGKIPGSYWVFVATAIGTCIGALLGCSPIIVNIESIAGIKEGGRTGLTGVVVSFWMLLSILVAPVVSQISVFATAPILIVIGAEMVASSTELKWRSTRHAIPAFVTMISIPMTFSIPNGVFFGSVLYVALYFTTCGYSADEHEVHDSAA